MATTVTITNYREVPFAHTGFTGLFDPSETRTKTFKQVNADDYSELADYDNLAAFGVKVVEDGTARPGVQVSTDGAPFTVANATHLVEVETDVDGVTATLPAATNVDDGHTLYIVMTADGGGDLIVDGDGAETINGSATATLADAGDVLRLKLDKANTNWVTLSNT